MIISFVNNTKYIAPDAKILYLFKKKKLNEKNLQGMKGDSTSASPCTLFILRLYQTHTIAKVLETHYSLLFFCEGDDGSVK